MGTSVLAAERRAVRRMRCDHLAEIRIGATVAIHAIVKDLSTHGARLLVARDAWLPESFHLAIPEIRLNRKAKCCWRRGDFVGLEFDII